MKNKAAPTEHRLQHLDVLRGFALLGILLVNFEWFARPLQGIVLGADPGLGGADLAVDWLIMALAEGKFYPLFSMLFGAGFALMFERARRRQTPFWGVYLRRLVLLLLFGIGHMLLIWAGDILVVYSLCAFVMILFFRNTPLKRLWKWALAFLLIPAVIMWLGAMSIALTQADPELHSEIMAGFEENAREMRANVDAALTVHAEGSYLDNVGQRIRDAMFTLGNALFWVPPVIGFFLIGRWLIQSGRLTHPHEHSMFFRRWRTRGLVMGLPLAVGATAMLHQANLTFPTVPMAIGSTLAIAGSGLLAMAYLSMVTLASGKLQVLAPAGRMALSNYLAQSLFWTWMLYGHGLGLLDQVPRWSHLFLALVFFAGQVWISRWWLARFRFGPAEWLWRSLTYWQAQPMRRTAEPS